MATNVHISGMRITSVEHAADIPNAITTNGVDTQNVITTAAYQSDGGGHTHVDTAKASAEVIAQASATRSGISTYRGNRCIFGF